MTVVMVKRALKGAVKSTAQRSWSQAARCPRGTVGD